MALEVLFTAVRMQVAVPGTVGGTVGGACLRVQDTRWGNGLGPPNTMEESEM